MTSPVRQISLPIFLAFTRLWMIAGLTTSAFFGCSTAPGGRGTPDPHTIPTSQLRPRKSSVDIHYSLARGDFRFMASNSDHTAQAQTFSEKKLIKSGAINPDRYLIFLKKASELVQRCQEPRKEEPPCRNPFNIRVQIEQTEHSGHGCRSSDGGALSHLINEGEFLLYSKN